eukprot:790460-Pyramimonas_sp.AAC.1
MLMTWASGSVPSAASDWLCRSDSRTALAPLLRGSFAQPRPATASGRRAGGRGARRSPVGA